MIELRSGRILKPVVFKRKLTRKVIVDITTKMHHLKLEADKDPRHESDLLTELKLFFRSLFYHCCKDIAIEEKIDHIKRTQGRKATLDELLFWKAGTVFWLANFERMWVRMQRELPSSALFQFFRCYMENEHNHLQRDEYISLETELRKYVHELYCNNDSTQILKLMAEQSALKYHNNKKVYIQELAKSLAHETSSNLPYNHPYVICCDTFFKTAKATCCYFSEDFASGQTIVRFPIVSCDFGMFSKPEYRFQIVNTGETFISNERDIRKAFSSYKDNLKML